MQNVIILLDRLYTVSTQSLNNGTAQDENLDDPWGKELIVSLKHCGQCVFVMLKTGTVIQGCTYVLTYIYMNYKLKIIVLYVTCIVTFIMDITHSPHCSLFQAKNVRETIAVFFFQV